MMVGNSVKSDILPAVEAGAWGAYIPYHVTWALERAEPPLDAPRFVQLARIDQVPALVERIVG